MKTTHICFNKQGAENLQLVMEEYGIETIPQMVKFLIQKEANVIRDRNLQKILLEHKNAINYKPANYDIYESFSPSPPPPPASSSTTNIK